MKLQHHFLIAMPTMEDPRFKHSVIYICEHNEEGAMGLVINKPMAELTIESVLSELTISTLSPDPAFDLNQPVFAGGPLAEDRGFILHSPCEGFSSSIQISPETMLTTSKDVLETLGTQEHPENVLLALGYAGWSQGQLEQELRDNVWLTRDADTKILFDTPIADRWLDAAKGLGIDIRNIASQAGHA